MTAPNIVNVTNILGKTVGYSVTTSLASTGVENPLNSNKVFKINTINCSNRGATNTTISVTVYKGGSVHYYITYNVTVPLGSTLVIVNKNDNNFYLEEGDSIYAQAGANSTIQLLISYEEIS